MRITITETTAMPENVVLDSKGPEGKRFKNGRRAKYIVGDFAASREVYKKAEG